MKAISVILGFLPLFAFSILSTVVGAAWAAVAAVVLAIVVVATTAKDGIKIVPAAQAVILMAMAVLAFTGGPVTDHALVKYGPALQGLLLGLFMVATAATVPFTAQYARSTVPSELWHSPRFLEVNRRISTVWGAAVLLVGVCHLAAAEIPTTGWQLALRLVVNWALPLAGFWHATVYTTRTAAEAQAAHEAYEHTHGTGSVRA